VKPRLGLGSLELDADPIFHAPPHHRTVRNTVNGHVEQELLGDREFGRQFQLSAPFALVADYARYFGVLYAHNDRCAFVDAVSMGSAGIVQRTNTFTCPALIRFGDVGRKSTGGPAARVLGLGDAAGPLAEPCPPGWR
jgi:hypothetical protein